MFVCLSKIYIHVIQFAKYTLIIFIWISAAKLSVFCQVWFFLKVASFTTNFFQAVVFYRTTYNLAYFFKKMILTVISCKISYIVFT